MWAPGLGAGMNEPDIFDALRERGIDAADPDIRAGVRIMLAHLDTVRDRDGIHAARRCLHAMHEALAYQLAHPDVDDMSTFEASFDEEE